MTSLNPPLKKSKIVELILEQVLRENEDEWQEPREIGVFRGSEIGDCPRAIQYNLRGYDKEQISAPLSLLFRDGHMHHNFTRELIGKVCRLTNIEHHARKNYTVEISEGKQEFTIKTTTDGIVNQDFIIDIKGINHFIFQMIWRAGKLASDVARKMYPKYFDQLQTYMDVYEKPAGCLLFKNKNTSALLECWYSRDTEYFSTNILPRLAKLHYLTVNKKWKKRPYKKMSRQCKQCFHRKNCWKVPMEPFKW